MKYVYKAQLFNDIALRKDYFLEDLDSMRESAAQAVQRIHVGTHEIEVDGLSVYRCSLWDASNVRNDGKPTFLQPRMPLRSLRASDKNQN